MESPSTISKLLQDFKGFLAIGLMLLLAFAGGYFVSNFSFQQKYDLLLGEKNSTIEELSIANNKVRSLSGILSDRDEEVDTLKEIIRSYENRPAEIEYIVKTETVFVGNTEETRELPDDFLFTFENGLPVSQFRVLEDSYSFTTFDIDFDTTVVISEDQTAVLLEATSSYDEQPRRIELSSVEVQKVREHKIIEPHIAIGLTGSLNTSPLSGDLSASVSVPWLHPRNDLDVISPRLSINSNSFRIGADVVSYNVGSQLPVFTDLWIGVGISGIVVPATQHPSIDLTIGSKF